MPLCKCLAIIVRRDGWISLSASLPEWRHTSTFSRKLSPFIGGDFLGNEAMHDVCPTVFTQIVLDFLSNIFLTDRLSTKITKSHQPGLLLVGSLGYIGVHLTGEWGLEEQDSGHSRDNSYYSWDLWECTNHWFATLSSAYRSMAVTLSNSCNCALGG